LAGFAFLWRQLRGFGEELVGFPEIPHPVDIDPLDDRGLADIGHGKNDGLLPACPCLEGEGECTVGGRDVAGEGEFSCHGAAGESCEILFLVLGDHTECYGQVETRPLFFDVRRGKVHRGPFPRPPVAAVGEGGDHAVLALLDRRVGQTYDDDGGFSGAGIDFDFDFRGINADHGGRKDSGDHWEG